VQDEEDEEALAEKFSEAFNQIDIDSEGSIVAEQLGSVLECLGMVRVISVSLGSREQRYVQRARHYSNEHVHPHALE